MLNKTFRLFISSTFNDFLLERRILNENIFSIVDEHCQQRGYNFQLIDLRWGINNESAINQNTLAICLDEVNRCKTLSPKPNFLIMAGERYGWVPLPTKIEKEDFEQVLSVATKEQYDLLTQWYIFDANEIGGEYYLKFRTGEYIDENVWAQKEKEIQMALISCAVDKLKFSDDKLKKITSSATEQEIIEGLLNSKDASDNTIAVFRTGYKERDDDQSRINNLKKRIIDKMTGDNNDNIIHLHWGADYAEVFEKEITQLLIKNIDAEIDRLEKERENKNQNSEFDYIYESSDLIFERKNEMQKLQDYVNSDDCVPMILSGDSGSGKTTLLAEFLQKTETKYFCSFYGVSEDNYTLLNALKSIIEKIKTAFAISKSLSINENNISEVFYNAIYAIPKKEQVLIVIDGIDMFNDIEDIKERVLPLKLPENVKLVVSCADQRIVERFSDPSYKKLRIEWFDSEESHNNFYELLKSKNRQIANENQQKIISTAFKCGTTPLQLKLMAQMCTGWRSSDENVVLPDSAETIALKYLSDMFLKYGHNRELVLCALALIAATPYGITEEELQVLLFKFDGVEKYFTQEDRYHHNLSKLPFVVWSRLFYDLKGCLTLGRSKGYIVVKFAHLVFYRVFSREYKEYLDKALDILIDYYGDQKNYVNKTNLPNVRKILMISTMLKSRGRNEELMQLLCDFTYSDACVKTGLVNAVISDLQYVIGLYKGTQEVTRLVDIYSCLQSNREMLNCYQGEFFSCANNSGLIEVDSLITSKKLDSKRYIHFPYPVESIIRWNKDGTKYLVLNNSYIYVCDGISSVELGKLYFEPENNEVRIVKEAIWLSNELIAVIANDGDIFVLDLKSNAPVIVSQFKSKTSLPHIVYSSKANTILFQSEKNLCAYNILNSQLLYEYKLKSKSKCIFCIDDEKGWVYIKSVRRHIIAFDVTNGKDISKIRNVTRANYLESIYEISLYRLKDNKWLCMREQSNAYIVLFDAQDNTSVYLHPPMIKSIKDNVIGNRYMLCVYHDMILCIDLLGSLKMMHFSIPNIIKATWKEKDTSICISTFDGVQVVELNEFIELPGELAECMHLSRNVLESIDVLLTTKSKYSIGKAIKLIFKASCFINNMMDYDIVFTELLSNYALTDILSRKEPRRATIIAFAKDGKTAVAYESENAITVFDNNDKAIVSIDKLKLSIIDNILKLAFSDDCKKLLLWRNDSVHVFDLQTAKEELYIDLLWRPAYKVCFGEDSKKLNIVLCDNILYQYDLTGINNTQPDVPEKLCDVTHSDSYFGAYSCYPKDGKLAKWNIISESDMEVTDLPTRWFIYKRIYVGEKYWLYYKNGAFYLNGEVDKEPFKNTYCDFEKCLQDEKLSEANPINSYLHQKNDILSSLIEIEDRYLVLVCRMLNSIILFDLEGMQICCAYKVDGNIIGSKYSYDSATLELVTDKAPFKLKLMLNLKD
ncbi:MAG: DUF4062 domain-containing protein [Ruminococcus sp.]|nr:DUF4062 domain-containing protein [Ruminococcus sp.]